MALAWYVIQVGTNMEDKVQSSIISTIIKKIFDSQEQQPNYTIEAANNLKAAFGIPQELNDPVLVEQFLRTNTILVPKERIEEIKNGKKTETERKIFPGYILVRMDYTDEYGLLIRKTPKVAGFVGVAKDSRPVPVPQKDIDAILQQVQQSKEKAKHKVEFEAGERVRITDGPFLDFNATIEEVLYNKTKLRVNVQIFGRETLVELDFAQVEKI